MRKKTPSNLTIEKMLTLRDVARFLSVHYQTVIRLAKFGDLPCIKVGQQWRITKSALDMWVLKRQQRREEERFCVTKKAIY